MRLYDFQHRSYDDKKQTFGNYIISHKGLQQLEDGRIISRWVDRHVSLEQLKGISATEISASENFMLSLNSYIPGKHKCADNIAFLEYLYTDIDCYKLGISREDAIAYIHKCIVNGSAKPYSYLISTGNGLLVIWKLVRVGRKSAPVWKRAQYFNFYLLAPIGADKSGVTDFTKSMRVPGSTNTSKGTCKDVQLEFGPDSEFGTDHEYTLTEFMLHVNANVHLLPEKAQAKFKGTLRQAKATKCLKGQIKGIKKVVKHDPNRLQKFFNAVLNILTKLATLRGRQGCKGKRELFCWILANTYAQMGYSSAHIRYGVQDFAYDHFECTDREIEDWMECTKNVIKMHKKPNGIISPGVALSYDRIEEKLEITAEEKKAIGWRVKARKSKRTMRAFRSAQRQTRVHLTHKIIKYVSKNPSASVRDVVVAVKGGKRRNDGTVQRILARPAIRNYKEVLERKMAYRALSSLLYQLVPYIVNMSALNGKNELPGLLDTAIALDKRQEDAVTLSSWLLE